MAQNLKFKRFFFEFTRPSDTTAYAAQDAVSNDTASSGIITWTERTDPTKTYNQKGLEAGGSYLIKSVKLTKSTNNTTNATFDMYFYTSGITTMPDNSQFSLNYDQKIYRIGKASLTMAAASTTASTCSENTATDVNHVFVAVGSTFYSALVATAAYTPGNGERLYGEATLIRLDE